MSESALPLSALEARVLGVLVEKEHTVPDTYPLTLNALVAGCNQKTSRSPVMSASEADVQAAVDELRRRSLVIESSGSRVMRYAENVKRVLGVPSQSVALLAMLALRGPQTAAELRANCERIHRFADTSSVEAFLAELAEREPGALVELLPRQPGAREARWAQLLCGPVQAETADAAAEQDRHAAPGQRASGAPTHGEDRPGWSDDMNALAARLDRAEREIARLSQQLSRLLGQADESGNPEPSEVPGKSADPR